mmetsp:Transcript_27111/g.41601  ORF Transcript_27111/g.41601 Transcript_27111/m.41601 type:complete len:790 (+) Transcript_27111:65-2434(+)
MNGKKLPATEPSSRTAIRGAQRVLVKAGTSVVTTECGRPSLTRLGAIAEQIGELHRSGKQVILVSSGAVGMGKRLLRTQHQKSMSFLELQNESENGTFNGVGPAHVGLRHNSFSFVNLLSSSDRPQTLAEKKHYDSACAAAGQFEMMNLYSRLFDQCDLTASQILLTQSDFQDEQRLKNLTYAVERLLHLGIVPIINENDAVSANLGYTADDAFSDNDSLAALCARTFGAEVLLLLTDVEGVFDRPPSEKGAKLLSVYNNDSSVAIGSKSAQGRGGMQSKIDSAMFAVSEGTNCKACVVVGGNDLNAIRSVLGAKFDPALGSSKGTLFVTPGTELDTIVRKELIEEEKASNEGVSEDAERKATDARIQTRKLQSMPHDVRKSILNTIAEELLNHKEELLEANAIDLEAATKNGTDQQLVKRLKLTEAKLQTLARGIRQLAEEKDCLGVVKKKRELADGLELSLVTVPIGVLMIIFESRPDCLPQISALALASGNGLLLKGGKEAANSNAALHKVIGDAIEKGSEGKISRDIVGLVTDRGQVADMLSLDNVIDLVIPRGSNALVSYIKANTRIPVLGHADGVCHVYIDESAGAESASKIVVDAKTDYPSACNAMETMLLHSKTLDNGVAVEVMKSLRSAGVKCLGGPRAMKSGLCDVPAEALKCEYGDLRCMVEVVENLDEAVDWIHTYGSGHTETIVCDDSSPAGEDFLKKVDAACVFKNASTRFADGFRFGLGAEVGISTGRIHARGPVGVEGLLTTKWQLRSSGVDFVAEFGGDEPKKTYTFKELDV